jgi:hypothetical protein
LQRFEPAFRIGVVPLAQFRRRLQQPGRAIGSLDTIASSTMVAARPVPNFRIMRPLLRLRIFDPATD